MKLKILFSLGIAMCFLFIIICIQGCDIKSPTENVNVIFNADAPSNSVSINIIDGKTNALIPGTGSDAIKIDIEGADKGKITDMAKNSMNTFKTADGILSFGILDGAAYPLKITVIASAEGYVTTSMPLTINAKGGSYNIFMVKKSDPPAGVVFSTSTIANLVGGVIPSETTASTTIINGASGIAKIKLPAGTIITDNNNAALSGSTTCEIVYYDPTIKSALNCFPGGFTFSSGGTISTMYTAGFASFEIKDASGKIAKNFSGAALPQITIEIPNGTNNYTYSRPIQSGDLIPILSYNPSNGAWLDENAKGGTVIAGSNSNMAISFNVNHLTYYNLDFKGPGCSNDIRIHFTSPCSEGSQPLRIELYSITNNFYECPFFQANQPANDPVMILNSAPDRFMIKVYNINGTLICTQLIEGCPSDVYLSSNNNGGSFNSISGNLLAVCPGGNIQIRPTIPVYYRIANTGRYYYLGYMINGFLSTTCIPYGNYDFMSYYNGVALYNLNVPILTNNVSVVYNLPTCY